MTDFFEVEDPRGYPIVCTVECWSQHILNKHNWMKGRLDDVKMTLESPAAIYQDAGIPERHIYYGFAEGNLYIKVVVDIDAENHQGAVVTVFPTANVKPGEKLLWSASNP